MLRVLYILYLMPLYRPEYFGKMKKKLNLKSDFSSFCTVKRTTTVARAQLRRNRQTSECGSTTRGAPFTASSEAERTVT